MKRKLLMTILTLTLVLCSILGLTACGHEHMYTTSVTAPTCTEQGCTTYTCSCGDSYVDDYVDALDHDFKVYIYNNDAKCEQDGTETAICSRDNCYETDTRTKTGTAFSHVYGDWVSIGNGQHKKTCANDNNHTVIESCSGGTATCTEKAVCKECNVAYGSIKHTYNQRVAENKYLKTSATCDSKAVYYYSCSCGEKGVETFENGSALGHAYGDWISIGNDQHKKTCANDNSHTIVENCFGGTATCTQKAVCKECNAAYGNTLEHSYGDTGYCVCGEKDEDFYTEGITFQAVAGGYTVAWYNGTSTTLVIPDYYNGAKVVAISETALRNCQTLKKIIVGNNVVTMPDGVFRNCTSLQYLTIPFVDDIFGKLFGQTSYYSDDTNYFIPDKVTGKKCSLGHLHQIPTSDAKWAVSNITKWLSTSDGLALWQGEWVSAYTTGLWECKANGVTCYTYYAASSLKIPVYYVPSSLRNVTISNQQISTFSDEYKTYFNNVDCSVTVLKKYPISSTEIIGASEVFYGEFDYNDYTIKTTHSDGLVEIAYLRKEYLSESDQAKLNTIGSHSITINYAGRKIAWNIVIKPLEFSGLGFTSKTFTYDGQTKNLAVTGLPAGAKVNYSNNNKIDAGTYTVIATISLENYRTTTLTATLKIEKRELNVKFSGATTIKYDGKSHKELTVSAINVVDGDSVSLSITYSGEMIEAGDYIATAILTAHKNYKLTTNNTCSIKITRETHTVIFKQVGQPDKIKTVLDLANLTDIPDVTTVTGHTVVWEDKDLTKVTKDITVNAIITINQYTISFVTKNGQTFDSITQDYNTEITLPKPTWAERSFVGWFDESLITQFTSTTMPAENITLYDKWINYEVFLNVDNLTGLSVNADLTDGLSYGVTAIDTDNNPVAVKAQLISGSQTAGSYITVRFVATGLHGVYATQMISDIKVYGMPAITYNTEKDYINDSDLLVASLFTATATDTFGESLFLNVSIKETGYKSGDTITIILSATDVVGNTTVVEIDSVKYYGTPTIVRNESVTEMKISDTISNEFFGVSATDSFGGVLTVNTVQYSGSFVGGNTITIKSSVTDSKGNSAYITYNVKVYGLPTITSASKTDFKEGEEINLSTLGIIAKDSFGNALENVTLSLTDGTNAAGNMLTYLVTATDHLGNVNTKTFSVKIYGTPTITYDANKTAIKATDRISASLLSATAKDSFGNTLSVTATLESGEIKGGSCITVKLMATDCVGNTYSVVTDEIRVYAQEDIVLTFNSALSNNIKKNSCGEEFNAVATDSFGEVCTITIQPASGYSLTGGATINLYLVATDKAGNTYTSELLTEKNVYDTPTLSYAREYDYIMPNDNPYLLFTVKDSFGADRLFDIEVISGSLQELEIIVYRITAEDKVGNKLDCEYTLEVIGYDENGFLILPSKQIILGYNSTNTNVVIPKDVIAIDKDAFKDNETIQSLTIHGNVKIIEDSSFSGCTSLKSLSLYEGITEIKENAFNGCNSLTNIIIPNSVTNIGSSAFSGCSRLTEITLPFVGATKGGTSVTHFGYIFGASSYSSNDSSVSTSLKKVTVTGGNIGSSAFRNCSSLTEIVISDSVTSIGNYAFYNCSSLTEITIPFVGQSIKANSGYNQVFGYIFGYKTSKNSATISGATYQYSDSSYYHYYIPTSLKKVTITSEDIPFKAFYDCNRLTNITIGDKVVNIGDYAFYNCSSLTDITIPDGITSIGYYTFAYCSSLNSIEIPNEVTSIDDCAFYECSSLSSIIIPDGVTSIGHNAFTKCINLSSVTLGANVKSIGSYAFYGCGFESIVIPDGVTTIYSSAFSQCKSLRSIVIPKSITIIGSYVFHNCTALMSIKYVGTSTEWDAITKYDSWNYGASSYTITYNYTDE